MKKAAIVIGHGPRLDKGAIAADGKTNELEWNRDLAQRIFEILSQSSTIEPILVNRVTEKLQPVKETNATRADMAIELHLNSTPSASGTEMIHAPGSKAGKTLATLLQQAAVCVLKLPDRGVKLPWKGRGLRWLRDTTMPAVIVESFFIDNPNDLKVATARKQQLAEAYADALIRFAQL